MAEAEFWVKYDGEAVDSGTIDVRDLAPSLIALSDLFRAASREVYAEHELPGLRISARRRGSFEVQLLMEAQGLWDHVSNFLSGDDVMALVNLRDLIIGAGGLVFLLKQLRGRAIVKRDVDVNVGVRLTLEDGTTLEISPQVLELHDNIAVRVATSKVVTPLRSDGVDRIESCERVLGGGQF